MYPLMISLLESLKKGLKSAIKILGKSNKNSCLSEHDLKKTGYDRLYGLSSHLQKDIGLPPYTSRNICRRKC